MQQTRIIMGMPITINISEMANADIFEKIFDYFDYIDNKFSTYKKDSEISKINRNEIDKKDYSDEMNEVFRLSEKTKIETQGFFNIKRNGFIDPSGLVKGWSIYNAYELLKTKGFKNFYIDAGGDIQISGKNKNKKWEIGIKNPFDQTKIVKTLKLYNKGIATSGTYIRGQHIYNPINNKEIQDVVSMSVIGPNIYERPNYR